MEVKIRKKQKVIEKKKWDIVDPVTKDRYVLEEGMKVVVVRDNIGAMYHGNNTNFRTDDTFIIDHMGESAILPSKMWLYPIGYTDAICPSLVRPKGWSKDLMDKEGEK